MKNKFLWGSAFSGPQTEGAFNEGGKSATTWDYWFKENPELFYKKERCKNDFYHNYKNDIKLAKDINFNSLRTSIQWARLIPDGINVNQEGVDFYNGVIDEMIKQGIEPIINLYHFDTPMWAQDMGGWLSREVVDKFALYAKTAFKLFGDRVKMFTTFNEPIVSVECGYEGRYHYPAIIDFKKAMQVQWNMIIAHHKAVHEYREMGLDGEIGSILNITPAIPRSNNLEDVKASKWAEYFQFKCFLDPMVKGVFPKVLEEELKLRGYWIVEEEGDRAIIKNNKIDFLGVNFYQPLRVKSTNKEKIFDKDTTMNNWFSHYEMPGRRMNKYRGWEIFPESLYECLKTIQNDYGNIKTYVAENGMGVQDEMRFANDQGIIQDDYRIDFLEEHLEQMNKAISEGANIFGYHMWTYIDNWSWLNAYKNRYGFYRLNTSTGERTPKKSASWIKKYIQDKNA